MPGYNYIVLNAAGKQRKASLEASSLETAKSSLRSAGYTILDIREQTALNRDIQLPFAGNPKARDMAVFCRQFVSILRAGVSVAQVLAMLGQQTANKKLRAAIREMEADVEKGETLSAAMRRHRRLFPSLMVNMVAAGEESGNLEDAFIQMERFFQRSKKTRAKIGRVMIYPCVLLAVMLVVLILMMTKIIPMFLQSFREMGAQLPAITQMVMAVSDWFVRHWLALLLGLGLAVGAGLLFRRTGRGKHFFGWLARRCPVVKQLVIKSACSTFCRTMEVLIGSGINLTDALALAAANMNNIYYLEALHTVRTQVSEGMPLHVSLEQTGLFPALVSNLVGVGEETGDLQGMMGKVADYYDEEVEEATDKLLALLEPAVILLMAVFVVILVFSIFLPMLQMTKAYDQYL